MLTVSGRRPARQGGPSIRGFTLLELLLASVIFVIVGVAVGTFYLATVKGFERGSAQGYVQRIGSQVESELLRHLVGAVAFHSGLDADGNAVGPTCGNPPTPASLLFERPAVVADTSATASIPSGMGAGYHPCRYCCIYQLRDTTTFVGHPAADAFPQLYLCTVNAATGGSQSCSGNIRHLTSGAPRSGDTGVLGIVAVEATTFTRVTSICNIPPFDPCGLSNTASNCGTETGNNCVPAGAPRVEVQFQICQPHPQALVTAPCSDAARPPAFSPLRFALTATARN